MESSLETEPCTTTPGGSGGGGRPPPSAMKSRNNSRDLPPKKDLTYYTEFGARLGFSLDQIQIAIGRILRNEDEGGGSPRNSVESDPDVPEFEPDLTSLSEDRLLKELLLIGNTKTDPLSSNNGLNSSKTSSPSITPSKGSLEIPSFSFDNSSESLPTSGENLRPIIIDGSNVAMCHGLNEEFSLRGIEIAVDWFRGRGHSDITVFVPEDRRPLFTKPRDESSTPYKTYEYLIRENYVKFTPCIQKQSPPPLGMSSTSGGSSGSIEFDGGNGGGDPLEPPKGHVPRSIIKCYDDRFCLRLAAETNGVVLSNDNFRDIMFENWEFRRVVENRLLMYTFVKDRIMIPEDPQGRHGPSLDQFLSSTPLSPSSTGKKRLLCPYGRNCTFGIKCKFSHSLEGESYDPGHPGAGRQYSNNTTGGSNNRSRNPNKNPVKQVHSVPTYHHSTVTSFSINTGYSSGGGGGGSSNNNNSRRNSPQLTGSGSHLGGSGGSNHKLALRTKSDCVTNSSGSFSSPQSSFEEVSKGVATTKPRAHKSVSSSSSCSSGGGGSNTPGGGKRKLERKMAVYCSLSGEGDLLGIGGDSGVSSGGNSVNYASNGSLPLSRQSSGGNCSSGSPPTKVEPFSGGGVGHGGQKTSISSISSMATTSSDEEEELSPVDLEVKLREIEGDPTKREAFQKVVAIFPQEQVCKVMVDLSPNETDPKVICKLIISKFYNK